MQPPASFLADAESLGIAFDPGDLDRVGRFLDLLRAANERMNLTAITEPEAMWHRHVLDSLTLVPYIAEAGAARVADVGAGGGLPGLPLAIVLPDVRFTLVEATGKKARFLRETAAALDLANVDVVDERAETIGRDRDHHREHYDVVLARALGRLPVLLELTVPLAKVGGLVLAVKGGKAAEEVAGAKKALHLLHAAVIDTVRTPTGTIVVVEKRRRTPKVYPRRPGEPKRAPLG
ncbi:MAG: 16S rRNA (guanine(527)-N(7))-methyltransferase RsmG [Planctomycetota bacterium]|jgi:16S rRNA (guanine527-N7)-methyltransferase